MDEKNESGAIQKEIDLMQELISNEGLPLKINNVKADGNCLYRAIADQINGDENHYPFYKAEALRTIKKHSEEFISFLEGKSLKEYTEEKEKDGAWGGMAEIWALEFENNLISYIFRVEQNVEDEKEMKEGNPIRRKLRLSQEKVYRPESFQSGDSSEPQIILLGHIADCHYVSLRNVEDILPNGEYKGSKSGRIQSIETGKSLTNQVIKTEDAKKSEPRLRKDGKKDWRFKANRDKESMNNEKSIDKKRKAHQYSTEPGPIPIEKKALKTDISLERLPKEPSREINLKSEIKTFRKIENEKKTKNIQNATQTLAPKNTAQKSEILSNLLSKNQKDFNDKFLLMELKKGDPVNITEMCIR